MNSMNLPGALIVVSRAMQQSMDGAITTGITPEPDGRTTPATSTTPAGQISTRGNLLSRAWRLAARPAARSKAASSATY